MVRVGFGSGGYGNWGECMGRGESGSGIRRGWIWLCGVGRGRRVGFRESGRVRHRGERRRRRRRERSEPSICEWERRGRRENRKRRGDVGGRGNGRRGRDGIGRGEGKEGFDEAYVSGDVDATGRSIEAEVGMLSAGVPKEDARTRARGEFVGGVGSEPGVTEASENPKAVVSRGRTEKGFVRRSVVKGGGGEAVD